MPQTQFISIRAHTETFNTSKWVNNRLEVNATAVDPTSGATPITVFQRGDTGSTDGFIVKNSATSQVAPGGGVNNLFLINQVELVQANAVKLILRMNQKTWGTGGDQWTSVPKKELIYQVYEIRNGQIVTPPVYSYPETGMPSNN